MSEYSLSELAALAGATRRTVRYYISQGLLPAPEGTGRGARYGDEHLARLRLIRKLQARHLPLAEIRSRLSNPHAQPPIQPAVFETGPDPASPHRVMAPPPLGGASRADRPTRPGQSAVEYIHGLLERPHAQEPSFAPPRAPSAQPPADLGAADESLPEPSVEPTRSQWDRVRLATDIELHIRRPLSRSLNKKVEHLVRLARHLLEEP